ncbi:protoporphyrinogen oxidase [Fluoribacter gormanii]|uniref:HemY protein n=1 Tax=Fluoribacter gormanii TaxID=464 RepID=A0A377GFZ6_9GAMM|nr:heme biosynthesis HemY N-terminal domain-containing protein [Fluoribacter gormanii]KTD01676.1 protoporphyrinogen oxidase [Fluoribacter gormanii]MCW8444960.1 protoporphyrinogen oxidase [Fluoribacter gormanii]MCW8470170.1 protoporphyrinogen oxidase [Fluoribacter gormanii]SIR64654.1 HemY protein [Fluoribacter gormanii]STO23473.1 putative protoheme IX biogenesis protein [Fluoribacter gormanii]
MMRILLAFLILLGSVALGIQLNKDPGYVLIAINQWTIETTAWVAVFGIIILFIAMYLVLRLCQKISHTPSTLTQWHSKRLAQKAQAITRKGLIEYSEGYWLKAKNHLIQALPNTDTPLLNYLTAARAAQKMGDNQLRDDYLREAQQSMPEAKIAVELTQAELQLANHQWEQALATLKHLHDIAPHHPYVLKLIMQLYQEVKDWAQLIHILPDLKKYQVVNSQEFDLLQYNAYLQRLIDLVKQNQHEAVNIFFNSLPKALANEPNIIAEYVRFLLKNADYTTASDLLRRALRKDLSPQLIGLYGLLPIDEKQLAFAEGLLKKNAHSAALYLCLGQICMKRKLWGKAKYYLEKSNEIEPTSLAYETQGQLHEMLGEEALACRSYKQGLALTTKDI